MSGASFVAPPWSQTFTGRAVDLLDPKPEQIHLHDISVALSRIVRFNGHTRAPLSVAQHCCLAEDLLPEDVADPVTRLHVLLHDAPEFLTGDISSPMKTAVRTLVGRCRRGADPLRTIDEGLKEAIYAAAGITAVPDAAIVAEMDLLALAAEKAWHMAPEPRSWGRLPSISGAAGAWRLHGTAWTAVQARLEFSARVQDRIRLAGFKPLASFLAA